MTSQNALYKKEWVLIVQQKYSAEHIHELMKASLIIDWGKRLGRYQQKKKKSVLLEDEF